MGSLFCRRYSFYRTLIFLGTFFCVFDVYVLFMCCMSVFFFLCVLLCTVVCLCELCYCRSDFQTYLLIVQTHPPPPFREKLLIWTPDINFVRIIRFIMVPLTKGNLKVHTLKLFCTARASSILTLWCHCGHAWGEFRCGSLCIVDKSKIIFAI